MVAIKRPAEILRIAFALLAGGVFLSLFQSSSAASSQFRLRASAKGSFRLFALSARRPNTKRPLSGSEPEIDRTVSYAQQIGCNNRKVLFFGSDPPAQCDQIRGQIGRMRANLEDLQSKAGGGPGGRGEMIARYNAQCV